MIVPQGSRRNARYRGPVESSKVSYLRNSQELTLKCLSDRCEANEVSTKELENKMLNIASRTTKQMG